MEATDHSHPVGYDRRTFNPLYHAIWGARFFLSGLRLLIKHPALLALSMVPILITVVLLVMLVLGSAWLVGQLIGDALSRELRVVTEVLIVMTALLLGYFSYLPVARVLLAPFSEAISRKAHIINKGELQYQSSVGWGRAIREGLKLVMFQAALVLIALALGLGFPPIGAPVGIAIAIFSCGLDFFDVPLSARGLPFNEKMKIIWRNKSLTVGFGVTAYLSLLIPVINLLSLPVGVIGATLIADALEIDSPEKSGKV